MKRIFPNWIEAFLDYASVGEAPRRLYFWTAVSTIAGALQRKVWFDQIEYKWHPNFYIVFVARPGIVSKTTTANIGMSILRQIPNVKFGADVITPQALAVDFAEAKQSFTYDGREFEMSALTFSASEFGNLLDTEDKAMINLLIDLWDGKEGAFVKRTKHSGNDSIVNPWINIIACTTPAWMADNISENMVGGGFMSRCIFVYADGKEREVPYLDEILGGDHYARKEQLVQGLAQIAEMTGPFILSPEARVWGRAHYHSIQRTYNTPTSDDRFANFIVRKQCQVHKLAMILSAAENDSRILLPEHLEVANTMLSDLESEMPQVFARIGRSDQSLHTQRLLDFIQRRGSVPYAEAYRYIHANFPGAKDFDDVMIGAVKAGYIAIDRQTGIVSYQTPNITQ